MVSFPKQVSIQKRRLNSCKKCPAYQRTPLIDCANLHLKLFAAVHFKDERGRMNLGSFKALGQLTP
jgi:threonine dehydratase